MVRVVRSQFAQRPLSLILAAVLLVPALASQRASADQFQPSGDPPTLTTPVLTMQGAEGAVTETPVTAFAPAWESSTDAYHATVTVGAPSLTASLTSVVLCVYLPSSHSDPAADCDVADRGEPAAEYQPDPTSLFLMLWERADTPEGDAAWPANGGEFRVVGDNKYVETASSTDWNDGTQNQLQVRFGFRVSNAMRKANDWVVRVIASDVVDRSAVTESSNVTVAYFEKIVTQRESVNYGVLAAGASVILDELDSGTYSANSRAQFRIRSTGSAFVPPGGEPAFTLQIRARGSLGSPGAAQIAIDCSGSSTFSADDAIRVDDAGFQVLFPTIGRSGESAAGLPDHSCRAMYGGGVAQANMALSNDLTVAIAESAPVPSNVAATASGTQRTVTWDAPAGADDDVTVESYVIEASTDSGATFIPLRRVESGTTAFTERSSTLDGLERDVVYVFRVTANTNVGAGSATGDADAQVPTAPQGLSVAEGDTSIVVSWQPPAGDGGASVNEYKIISTDQDGTSRMRTVGAGSTSTTFTSDSGFPDGTYTFTVAALNAVGEGVATPPSAPAQLATAVPVAETFTAGTGRTGSFQTFTVPATGDYVLEVNGAQGGGSSGGRGAKVTATFALTQDDVLVIMAGHRGGSATGAAGGGGASAVWRRAGGTGTPTLLAIAGGGGGVTGGTAVSTAHASTSANGNAGSATSSWFLAAGGVNGQSGGGTTGFGGAGGGGGIGDGRPERNDNRNAAKITSTQALGGTNGSTLGGFGGGAAARNNGTTYLGGGGGGGYSGGGGASSASGANANGGGGGSWVASSRVSQSIVSGATNGNTGAGEVTVRTP